jgi:zinc transport system ATP-binding protein
VPQSFTLNPSLPITVRRFLSLDKRIDPIRIDETLEALALSQHQSTSLHQLSGGERQRVLVARALLRQPDLLVLDEPAQNLDVRAQLKLYELLSEFYKQSKISILMVSHDLHLVMSLTTQVICLYQHICCAGSPKMVTKDPAFTHLFGDEFAQMMAVYHHQHDHGHHHE